MAHPHPVFHTVLNALKTVACAVVHAGRHLLRPVHGAIARLQRIKQWHVSHKADHPLEYQLWDGVLTLWVMGLVAWLPAYALGAGWVYPLCVLGALLPGLYIRFRLGAHRALHLRCDWANLV